MKVLARLMLLWGALLPAAAPAGEVISNESLSLTSGEIREVFLGEKQLADGLRLVPVDNRVAQEEFLSKVLQTDAQKYYARWTRKSFREGMAAPALKGGDAEVIAYVKSTRGAIGYINGHSTGVKVLQTF
jgi:ABC-type phosphate transport system substrate-binding protein